MASPPVHSRFRPGHSGNPKGRPKGAKNRVPALNEERMKAIVLEEAYRTIAVKDGGRTVPIPMAQAVIRALAHNAVKGHQRAQRLFTDLLHRVELANKLLHDEWLQTAIEYKVGWENELERRKRFGLSGPEPLPHPDDIFIDLQAGTATVRGPMTKEDKANWVFLRQRKAACDQQIIALVERLRDESDEETRQSILADIERERDLRAKIAMLIPD